MGNSKSLFQSEVLQENSKWGFLGARGKSIRGKDQTYSQDLVAPIKGPRQTLKAQLKEFSRKSPKEQDDKSFGAWNQGIRR